MNPVKETNIECLELDYWLMENMKIMEELSINEPSSWSEQDWGG